MKALLYWSDNLLQLMCRTMNWWWLEVQLYILYDVFGAKLRFVTLSSMEKVVWTLWCKRLLTSCNYQWKYILILTLSRGSMISVMKRFLVGMHTGRVRTPLLHMYNVILMNIARILLGCSWLYDWDVMNNQSNSYIFSFTRRNNRVVPMKELFLKKIEEDTKVHLLPLDIDNWKKENIKQDVCMRR